MAGLGLFAVISKYQHRKVKLKVYRPSDPMTPIDIYARLEENVGIAIASRVEGVIEAIRTNYS
jgi:hypothetical protein